MAKEGRKKVKSNTSSSLKYVISDEDTLSSDNYDSSDDDKPLVNLWKILMLWSNVLWGKLELGMSYLSNKNNFLLKREKLAKNSRSS
jgi:hypothetical protein